MKRIKKYILFIMSALVVLFAFCSCSADDSIENVTEAVEETTGYESGTIQFQTVMINNCLYVYGDEGWLSVIPETYELYGEIKEENNEDYPTEELHASRIAVGQKVYVNSNDYGYIYVQNEDGTYGKYYPEGEGPVDIGRKID